jgi:hypothetical protein
MLKVVMQLSKLTYEMLVCYEIPYSLQSYYKYRNPQDRYMVRRADVVGM